MISGDSEDTAGGAINGINITPFTDVCLVLLIIFLVTMPKIAADSIKVPLPKAGATQKNPPTSVIVHIIAHDGKTDVMLTDAHISGKIMSPDEMETELAKDYNKDKVTTMLIKAAANVPYDTVLETIDTARSAGFTDFGLASKADDTEPPHDISKGDGSS